MNNKQEAQLTFKVLLIGSSGISDLTLGVGKSSLLLKYIKNTFSYDYHVTTGVEFYTKFIKINEKTTIKMQIWDTVIHYLIKVGQETFRAIVRSFYKGVSAIILTYSIDRQESFEQLSNWMKEIQENAHKESMIWVVGAKLDLEDIRKVSRTKVEEYAKSIDAAGNMEVSAKTGENVKELFEKIGKNLYKKFNSSQAFKELVNPMLSEDTPMKSQSFNLNEFNKQTFRKDDSCC